jgi:P-type Ca2+ transporter type 2C
MGVVIQLPGGALRAHCKGASEIILASCNKYLSEDGSVVPLDGATIKHLNATIESFANEALRTLCLRMRKSRMGSHPMIKFRWMGTLALALWGSKTPSGLE